MTKLRFLHLLIISISLSLLLNSCSSNTSVISSSYLTAFNLLKDSLIQRNGTPIDYEEIQNIPYASLLFNFNKSQKSLLILESKQNNQSRWVSAGQKTITIEDGRIIETFGFPNDLLKIRRSDLSFREIIEGNDVLNTIAYYSFKKPDFYNLKVEVQTRNLGLKTIEISGKIRELYLIEETIVSKKINWSKRNRFWVDPQDYYVWRSEQDISPRLPRVFITVTKKPAI